VKSAVRPAQSPASQRRFITSKPRCVSIAARAEVICPDDAIMNNHGEITHVLKRAELRSQWCIRTIATDAACAWTFVLSIVSPRRRKTRGVSWQVQVNEKTCVGCLLCEEFAMGRIISCRPDRGAVPEFDRLFHRERRRLIQSRTLAKMKSSEPAEWAGSLFFWPARSIVAIILALLLPLLTVPDSILAAETSTVSGEKHRPPPKKLHLTKIPNRPATQ